MDPRVRELGFLLDSSKVSVQEFELSQRNLAANLSKQLKALIDEIMELRVNAETARLLLDNWEELRGPNSRSLPGASGDVGRVLAGLDKEER